MPLILEGRVPSQWLARRNSQRVVAIDTPRRPHQCINLALINNMPDAALEDTELQFFELLDAASGCTPIYLKLYSLTGVPRTDRGQRHLNSFYFDFDDLWKSHFDGVIITGTEPHHPDLRNEPYWGLLAEVLDWAQRNTSSTILSCLAAHASVLHCDGISRHRLADKQFGVFESTKNCDDTLIDGIPNVSCFPHSRWNEVRASDLTASGYTVLTSSPQAGVDAFAKRMRRSLFLHFQGHPEYSAETLFKEYRRDIKRFLRAERDTYPSMPHGYFDPNAAELLNRFQQHGVTHRHEEAIDSFPESVVKGLRNSWHSTAAAIYRNWLRYIAAESGCTSLSPAITSVYSAIREKRSVV
jgi:homoserine O-succinyltransferase/O-acetyltransferase